MPWNRDETGAVTIVVLALAFALVFVAGGAGSVVATVVGHRVAQNAADLAALAAAGDLALAKEGCATASVVAGANQARLVSCVADGRAVVVEVAVEISFGVGVAVRARARAGPMQSPEYQPTGFAT